MSPSPVTSHQRVPRSNDRIIAGIAGGWADRWQVEPTVLRACVGLLTLAGGGIGIALYGLAALASAPPLATQANERPSAPLQRRHLALGAATAAILVMARSLGVWPGDGVMLPAAAVAIGIAVIWTVGDRNHRNEQGDDNGHGGRDSVPALWSIRLVQVIAGLTLLSAGVLSLANRTGGLANVGASASAIAVVLGGLATLAAPATGRVLRSLDHERALRIREDERATMAAHLHDSVLQSLVLMQRTDDPRRMASLARRQERELRSWLYGTSAPGEPTSLHAAIDALTVEIENDHDVRVEAVVVGDQPLDDTARALVAAIREALVNAAQHAGVDHVDVFVEADDTELTGFVRDTGKGFERAAIPDDRRGISDSIVGRVHRAGGTAVVVSEPSVGTEVELRIPRGGR